MTKEETNKKIEELQILETHLQNFLAQRQGFQLELNEADNAITELKKTNDDAYKIISGVMLKSEKSKLTKELEEKKKILEMRISAIEKQEQLIEKKASELRKDFNEFLLKERKIEKKN